MWCNASATGKLGCGEKGHQRRECPNRPCLTCWKSGHAAVACPSAPKLRVPPLKLIVKEPPPCEVTWSPRVVQPEPVLSPMSARVTATLKRYWEGPGRALWERDTD